MTSPSRWRCALCAKLITHARVKQHLNTAHRDWDQERVNAEWRAFLEDTGQLALPYRAQPLSSRARPRRLLS